MRPRPSRERPGSAARTARLLRGAARLLGGGRLAAARRAYEGLRGLGLGGTQAQAGLLLCRTVLLCGRGRMSGAGEAWRRLLLLERDPAGRFPGALFGAAKSLERSGDRTGAEWLFRRLLEVSPRDEDARRDLAELLSRRAEDCRDRGLWRRAEGFERELAALPCARAGAGRARRVRSLLEVGEYGRAFSEGERLLDRRPTLDELRALYSPWDGRHLERLRRRHLPALEAFSRGRPGSAWLSYALGLLSRDPAHFDAVLSRSPRRYGWLCFPIGRELLCLLRFERAREVLELALRRRPDEWRSHALLAETLLCLKDPRGALASMDRAVEAAPERERGEALAWRGELLLWEGRYGESLDCLLEAEARGGGWAACWSGAAKVMLGRAGEGLADLDRALRRHPRDGEALLWRGEALRLLGRPREAVGVLADPGLAGWEWADWNRALALSELGDLPGMSRELARIPQESLGYAASRAGLEGASGDGRAPELLRAGLALARGYRRNEPYGAAVWMR